MEEEGKDRNSDEEEDNERCMEEDRQRDEKDVEGQVLDNMS